MVHERLDMTHWKSVFSLEKERANARAAREHDPEVGGLITGPADIALLEQMQEEAFALEPGLECVPTDIFVWNRGEPTERAVTKIGGLPYREAGKPWPLGKAGTPMTFVAQFCFADSRDLVPALPGDVLLIFTVGVEYRYKNEIDYYPKLGNSYDEDSEAAFEWVSLGDFPLTTQAEIPQTGWQIQPCYGTIYRTWDYPTVDAFAHRHISENIQGVIWATKIGGICPWMQGEEDIPGEFLCALGSVFPNVREPFPFLNEPEPITHEQQVDSGYLMIADVGLLYLFRNGYGDIRYTIQGG
jgi:hypothetical protein